MAETKRYLIYNTTRKPFTACPKTGKDLRSVRQKVGHTISFRDENNESRMVAPGQPPAITTRISEGLLLLRADGQVHVKEMKDISEAMAAHAITPETDRKHVNRPEASTGTPKSGGLAVKTGHEDHEKKRGGRETDEARNPDGDPNFLAKTQEITRKPGGGRRRRGSGGGEAAAG